MPPDLVDLAEKIKMLEVEVERLKDDYYRLWERWIDTAIPKDDAAPRLKE